MLLVVVIVLLKITLRDFPNKTNKVFKLDTSEAEQLVLLEDLVSHELERVFVENRREMEHVKSGQIHFFQGHLEVLLLHVGKVNKLQKFCINVFFCQQSDVSVVGARASLTLLIVVQTRFAAFSITVFQIRAENRRC